MPPAFVDSIPGLIGAAVGGVVGCFALAWGASYSINAGVIAGALVGLGSGLLSARPSRVRGIICAIGALGVGTYAQWASFPFVADNSFGYFLSHFHQQVPLVLIMLALGTYLGYRWGGDALKPVGPPRVASRNDGPSA